MVGRCSARQHLYWKQEEAKHGPLNIAGEICRVYQQSIVFLERAVANRSLSNCWRPFQYVAL
jgi:hypothetical protein